MKKSIIVFFVLSLLLLTGCTITGPTEEQNIDQNLLLGTWESSNDTESVSLTLNSDQTFSFVGIGKAIEEENINEVMLKEDGTYEIEGNKLVLSIKDVTTSGLEYENFVKDNLGNLYFFITLEDENQVLTLIETDGSVTYILDKVEEAI